MVLTLMHGPNPDISPGGYRDKFLDPSGRPVRVRVKSIREAVAEAMDFRDRNRLGSGNWYRAELDTGRRILSISYNGRAWFCEWDTPGHREVKPRTGPSRVR